MRVPTARDFLFSTAPLDPVVRDARERAFFHAIRLRNGTNKTTYARRLDSVNEVVNPILPRTRPLEIMDVGVSSGISTLEWMESLDRAGVDYQMTAGDVCVKALLVPFTRWLNILVDDSAYPLQFDICGKAVPYPPGLRRAILAPPLVPLVRAFRLILPRIPAARLKARSVEVLLVNPRLKERGVAVVEDDLLVPGRFRKGFDVVRAANVLNKHYFRDDTLIAMAANLRERLKAGGTLVVCRTDEHDVNHGTVFGLSATGRLEVVRRFGGGSEIEDLVLAAP